MIKIIRIWNHLEHVRKKLEDLFEMKWKEYKDSWKERTPEWMFKRLYGEIDETHEKWQKYQESLITFDDASIGWHMEHIEGIQKEVLDYVLTGMMLYDSLERRKEELQKKEKKK